MALRKIQPLLDAGALVTVISPEISAGLERIAKSGRIAVERRGYHDGDMRGCYLVYAATDDSELQRHLFEEARRIGRAIGLDLEEGSTGGGSDGNFTAALGVPTLDGLGAIGAGAHAEDEHVDVATLPARAALLAAALLELDPP